VQFVLAFPLRFAAILSPMLIISLVTRVTETPKTPQAELLAKLPGSSTELITELAAVQVETQELISKLESDTKSAESLLQQKQQSLKDLERKIALLQLTPEQRTIVQQYNRTLTRDLALIEWLSLKTTWYGIFASFFTSFIFYRLGKRKGRQHQKV
jgi:hypothetical protein